jgi:hypothetical protein
VLYQSLTGQLPFPGTTLEQVAMAHMVTPPKGLCTASRNPHRNGRRNRHWSSQKARRAVPNGQRLGPSGASSTGRAGSTDHLANVSAHHPGRCRSASEDSSREAVFAVRARVLTSDRRVGEGGRRLDDHYGQIGRISDICDEDDEDDFDVIVEFRGDPSSYAFRRDELATASASARAAASPDRSRKNPRQRGVKRPDVSVAGVIIFLAFLVFLTVFLVVAMAALTP